MVVGVDTYKPAFISHSAARYLMVCLQEHLDGYSDSGCGHNGWLAKCKLAAGLSQEIGKRPFCAASGARGHQANCPGPFEAYAKGQSVSRLRRVQQPCVVVQGSERGRSVGSSM